MTNEIKVFLDHLAFERRLSENTVAAYQADLEHFLSWSLTHCPAESILTSLDHYHIREYLSHCFHRYKATSIVRRLSSLRTFLKFLVKIGQIKSSPADLIANPKIKKPLPKPVTVEEAFAICDLSKTNSTLAVRNLAMCEMLYATGLRISEMCSLDVDNVDFSQRIIRVMGKGKKERLVPFHEICQNLLTNWLKNHRFSLLKNPNETALFLGSRGERILPRVVRYILTSIGQELNINRSLHPHRLRHAYATHMLQSGADLRSIQELLGHATISSTERYTDVDLASLMKDYDKAHPHAKKRN